MFSRPQVNFYVADAEVSMRFYRELFGFRETFRTPQVGRPIHIEMRLDGFTLGLGDAAALRRMHGVAPGGDLPRAELVVWTDDVDRAYAEVLTRGARPLSPPHDFGGMLRAAWVADPDGHPVQIVMRSKAQ